MENYFPPTLSFGRATMTQKESLIYLQILSLTVISENGVFSPCR
jgi:hypothetical protein